MTKNPSPQNDPGLIDPVVADLDNLHLGTNAANDDASSAPSITPRPRTDIHGESASNGGELSFNSSMPETTEDLQRTVKGSVGIIGFVEHNPSTLYCCGFVGSGKSFFCTKLRGLCETTSHINNKFVPKPYHFYIYRGASQSTACCSPCASHLQLNQMPGAEQILLDSTRKTASDWKALFDASKSFNTNHWTTDIKKHMAAFNKPLSYDQYKTPAKLSKTLEKEIDPFSDKPISADVENAMKFIKTENIGEFYSSNQAVAEDSMGKLLVTVDYLLKKLSEVDREIKEKAPLYDVAEDVANITASISGLKSDIGNNIDAPFPDLWAGVTELSTICTNSN